MKEFANENYFGEDFDVLLPSVDLSNHVLDDNFYRDIYPDVGDICSRSTNKTPRENSSSGMYSVGHEQPLRGKKSGITTRGSVSEVEKKEKGRKQIALSSRTSRARRKHEIERLHNENIKLRGEQAAFLDKINNLEVEVEKMRKQVTETRIQKMQYLIRN